MGKIEQYSLSIFPFNIVMKSAFFATPIIISDNLKSIHKRAKSSQISEEDTDVVAICSLRPQTHTHNSSQ